MDLFLLAFVPPMAQALISPTSSSVTWRKVSDLHIPIVTEVMFVVNLLQHLADTAGEVGRSGRPPAELILEVDRQKSACASR